jgi:molybdopterin converting factor small subunit
MKARLFAALRELAGASEVDVEARDVAGLLEALSRRLGPRFDQIMMSGTVVVNGEPAARDRPIGPDDEVALLPPVSGGR